MSGGKKVFVNRGSWFGWVQIGRSRGLVFLLALVDRRGRRIQGEEVFCGGGIAKGRHGVCFGRFRGPWGAFGVVAGLV
jgi:hypothetical protein